MRAIDLTGDLDTRVNKLETEATAVTNRGTAAYEEATTAHDNETQVFNDAANMLDIMQHFSQKSLGTRA